MVGFGLDYACAHIIILAEISSENLLPIRADFVTERVIPVCAIYSYRYTDKVAHKHTHMLQTKDVLCSLLYCVAIPAGGSANSITESARAVSPM